ncbi:MAG: hypothetical protein H7301_13145 [Cryobacterium sp.]|nr:hypothetical protein [Oligoflexia bacterium]
MNSFKSLLVAGLVLSTFGSANLARADESADGSSKMIGTWISPCIGTDYESYIVTYVFDNKGSVTTTGSYYSDKKCEFESSNDSDTAPYSVVSETADSVIMKVVPVARVEGDLTELVAEFKFSAPTKSVMTALSAKTMVNGVSTAIPAQDMSVFTSTQLTKAIVGITGKKLD